MNIPNMLSLVRLALVPIFPVVFFGGEKHSYIYALLVYAFASFTDIMDGFIARRFNMVSRLGRILDPLADKLMAFTVLTCIAAARIVPYWAVVIFFCKEALMGLGALTLYQKTDDVMPSNWMGKGAGVFFFLVCCLLLIFPKMPSSWALAAICTALTLNILAFFNYLRIFIFTSVKH